MRSMTAYASVQKNKDSQAVQVVLRSSNHKYLDIFIHNLSPEEILLEEKIRQEIKKVVYRGKVEAFVFFAKPQAKKVYINEKVVARYISQIRSLSKKYRLKGEVNINEVLNLPQALFWEQKGRGEQNLVLPALEQALKSFVEFKEKEGRIIKNEMLTNLRKLKENIQKIKKHKPKIGEKENGKEDIDEEISLMAFYADKLENKINSKKITLKGKSIDFLALEILRELNAASSKTKKKIPALMIVEAKNYLERVREQAQNIE